MTRLLIECSYVFDHHDANSGIQRVVRNVIGELPGPDSSQECIPVAMLNGKLYQVISLKPLDTNFWNLMSLKSRLENISNTFWLWHQSFERKKPFTQSHFIRRVLYVLCRLTALACFSVPIRLCERFRKKTETPQRCIPLQHQAGDQLILLDSSWHANFFPLAEQLKRDGVGIVSVIYDLIPLTHPQFCDAGLVKVFNEWFDWIARTADGYISISSTISEQVREEVSRRLGPGSINGRWFDYFHLGSELDLNSETSLVDHRLNKLFKTKEPVYLMVSTIEPRKNHQYLIDAFEKLWLNGSSARLCIIGRIGWKCDMLIERIRRHPELNQRLFMFNSLNDKSLEFAYSHSTALVFPSYVEGFGLPLVEAMQRGLPAMGSDIPVFHEIGGDFMAYFDLSDPQSLADLVTYQETTGEFPASLKVSEWRWLGWREASAQLIDRVMKNLGSSQKQLKNSLSPAKSQLY